MPVRLGHEIQAMLRSIRVVLLAAPPPAAGPLLLAPAAVLR